MNHGIPSWLFVQRFYNVLNQSLEMSIGATAGGTFMGKSIEVTKTLLGKVALNNYHWSSKRISTKSSSSKYNVDAVDLLAPKVDALAQGFY